MEVDEGQQEEGDWLVLAERGDALLRQVPVSEHCAEVSARECVRAVHSDLGDTKRYVCVAEYL